MSLTIQNKFQGDAIYDNECIEIFFMPMEIKKKKIVDSFQKLKFLDFLCMGLLLTGLVIMGIEVNKRNNYSYHH